MRRKLCILTYCLHCAVIAMAVPAMPGWHTITQKDGTTLKIQAIGNAFNNALVTTDGLTVARGADGDFYYMSSVTGLTAMRAHTRRNSVCERPTSIVDDDTQLISAARRQGQTLGNREQRYGQRSRQWRATHSRHPGRVPGQEIQQHPRGYNQCHDFGSRERHTVFS